VNSKAGAATVVAMGGIDDRADDVAAFLAADPELESHLPEIEERVLHHFGPDARLERTVFHPQDEEDPEDVFILQVLTDMSFDERIARLKTFIAVEDEFIAPVRQRLTIGIL
jgi:hypothetical protein